MASIVKKASNSRTAWIVGLTAAAAAAVGAAILLKGGSASAAPSTPSPSPGGNTTPPPGGTTPGTAPSGPLFVKNVVLGGGVLTPVSFPSFQANPNQQLSLVAPAYTDTSPPTYGVLSSNVSSSNQSVIAITPLMQQQSSPTNGQITYAISGPGTTTLSGSYVDNNGATQNWSVNVTVAP
jgi:hypothetical protein